MPHILFSSEEVCYDQKKIGLLARVYRFKSLPIPLDSGIFLKQTHTVADTASASHRIPY